ncbi:MAG: hypothetical protein Ta2B_22810 [Termitinemataceae bacterium]|nr:MAG: hypothetical protein Ta2B_22810 [Termitinemataceae bacterium]
MINRKKILVVDNDPLNLQFFGLMLSKLGFAFEQAQDGQEAIEKIASTSPDLVLLETTLPAVSGWDVLKSIRNDPKNEALPVLLLSKIDNVKEIVEGFELGADDYIIKPFNFSVMLARMRAALRSRVLFSELNSREDRLALFEKFNKEMKKNISAVKHNTDSIEEIIAKLKKLKTFTKKNVGGYADSASAVLEKTRQDIKKLESSMKQLQKEMTSLKQNEIGLPILKTPIRTPVGSSGDDNEAY